jgi:DNA polymerase-1
MEKLVVIDSYSLIYKAYYAIREMRTSSDIPTNAIYGFINMLIKIIKEQSPDYIYAAFDAKTPTFRHEASDKYKATRQKMPDELAVQIEYILQIIDSLGITVSECEGYEADDLLGTYSKIAAEKNLQCVLITGDRDSFQLADDNTTICYAKRGVTDIIKVDKDYIQETYKMSPRQLIDLKALMGDKSDNISGIAGIGEKTAQKLIIDYKDLDGIYGNIDSIEGKLKEKLISGRQDALSSRFLAEISKDAPIDDNLKKYSGIADEDKLFELLSLLE